MSGWFELTLGAAFLAGLAGGAHCAAMCGGLVGIACDRRAREMSRGAWWRRALAYNAGRIASYAAAGALTGALGAAGLALRGTPLVQQGLLALMSAALIAALATANPLHGALLMAAFGLGTLPNLLAIGAWFGYVVKLSRARVARAVLATLIVGVGVFGVVKATQPDAHAAHGLSWNVPGIASLLNRH